MAGWRPVSQVINCTTQLGVVLEHAKGALDLTVNVTAEDIKGHHSPEGHLILS